MRIFSGTQPTHQHAPVVILSKDDWNDWFTWYTLFSVQLVDKDGRSVHLGRVKIGRKGMNPGAASTQISSDIPGLDDSYFSLGQDENYYETLISLGDELRKTYLIAMRDCAFSLDIFDSNSEEPVMRESLLRYVDSSRVRERFHRLATGRPILTAYSFEYRFPAHPKALTAPPVLCFSVTPASLPATNVHVLIGRNGVGKSRCFDLLARAFLGMPSDDLQQGVGELVNTAQGNMLPFPSNSDPGFAGLVTVSFSAFDSRGPLTGITSGVKRYAYVGLVTHEHTEAPPQGAAPSLPRVKGLPELAEEFAKSVLACREGVRRQRWKNALKALESDPLFAEASVSELADDEAPDLEQRARVLYSRRLSSGHAIVLLTITRLVELVEEKSLVLIDEPESHLHPPLLSAFVRALSDLLIERNGVALIATHSPVVLQEVPSSCAWKLSRAGYEATADRPEIETFGENVGVLTREIFGLEVTQTGFHRLIAEKALSGSYASIMAEFGGQLGAEARALARALSILPPTNSSSVDADD
ncbi:ATP-binding protein [Burkholderia gladioli]|uniref:AAA family ATPase n=1 Tax=Burkholderia gladioli TaxID=28095 RepID=UPI001C21C24E|nr:ATP-binding protein [Burkholderia gladioli]